MPCPLLHQESVSLHNMVIGKKTIELWVILVLGWFSGPFMMKCILYSAVPVNCALTLTHSKERKLSFVITSFYFPTGLGCQLNYTCLINIILHNSSRQM